jgi:hypothetical protein
MIKTISHSRAAYFKLKMMEEMYHIPVPTGMTKEIATTELHVIATSKFQGFKRMLTDDCE